MALDTIDLHGQILAPVTNVPAVGTVTFRIVQDLRDTVADVVYSPQTFVATLDVNGEFTIELPVTDSPDVTPLDWTYWVYVDTDVWNSGVFYMALPESLGPVAEFADILPIFDNDCTPDGIACAPISVLGQIAELEEQVDALAASITGFQDQIDALSVDVADAVADVAAMQAAVDDLVADVAVLQGQVAGLSTSVGTLASDVLDLQTDVLAIQGQITTIQGQITTLQGQVALNTADIATNASDIAVIQGQVTAIQANVTTLQGDLTSLTTRVTTLEGNVVFLNPVTGAVYVGNTVTGPDTTGSQPWLKTTPIPYSAADTNFDFLRILAVDEFGNTVQTFTLNGQGEPRSRPSKRDRVGFRAFESAEAVGYSTGQFWQASSNPTVAANRKPYLGVWGTAATKPGWAEATEVLSGLKGVSIGGDTTTAPYNTLSAFNYRGLKATPGAPAAGTWAVNDVVLDSIGVVYRCTVAGTPGTWVAAVPTTLTVTAFTGAAASATLISDGATTGAPYVLSTSYNASENRVWMDGAVVNGGGGAIAGGTVLFTIAAAHAPSAWVQFNERTSTTLSARVTIRPNGEVRIDQSLAAGATVSFDGLNWRKS